MVVACAPEPSPRCVDRSQRGWKVAVSAGFVDAFCYWSSAC